MTLVEAVRTYTEAHRGTSPFITPIEGLVMLRAEREKPPSHLVFKPSLCITLQGAKRSTFGDRRFVYGPDQALVVSVEMPAVSTIIQASPREPYLGIVLELDPDALRESFQRMTPPPNLTSDPEFAVLVADFDGALADCVLRMVRLLDTPRAIPAIAPLIMREICYWLLSGPNGSEIARFVLASSRAKSILDAIHALRDGHYKTIRIEELADIAQMSPSAFHREFKAVTSMSPLQYQKHLRLLQARQLMATGIANVETAAYQVGYESPSQFSREYTRMFGASPRRDIAALRAGAA